MTKHSRKPKTETTHCPNCDHWARVLRSEQVSKTLRIQDYECSNTDCRHHFQVSKEVIKTIKKRGENQ